MLKYTIEKTEPPPTPRNYPYFGISVSGLIVRFSERCTGVVFGETGETINSNRSLGEIRTDWLEDTFTPIDVQEIVFKVL